ncbi:MAG: translation initiation factor IF-2 [Bacteroidota bacterium]
MAVSKGTRLFKIASQINIGKDAIIEYLQTKGFEVENKPTSMLSDEMVTVVLDKFQKEVKAIEKQREKLEKHRREPRREDEPVKAAAPTPEIADETKETKKKKKDEEPEVKAVEVPVIEETIQKDVAPALEIPDLHAEAPVLAQIDSVMDQQPIAELKNIDTPDAKREHIVESVQELEPPVSSEINAPTKELLKEDIAKVDQPVKVVAEKTPEVVSPTLPVVETAKQTPAEAEAERHKKKRKNIAEVQYEPGGARPQLRGLNIVGKIDLRPPVPFKREERRDDRRDGGGNRGGGGRPDNRDNRGPNPQFGGAPRPAGAGGDNRPPRPGGGAPPPRPGGGGFGPRPGGGPPAPFNAAAAASDKKKKRIKKLSRDAVSPDAVDRAIRSTLAGMDEGTSASSRSKLRQKKRGEREEREDRRLEQEEQESTILKITEFLTTSELANLMEVSPGEIISKCMSLGLMVTINQRLDKDTITVIADDFGYQVEFIDQQTAAQIEEEIDEPETLQPRPPIVTIMGHVDHGKTSLLDYIRSANVVAGESGGITQHIGAYKVQMPDGRNVAFLDTPGHEAFTAMRARGAQVTDIVVLVVAADDSVMPQTIEAISHALAANVPIVVAINKIDKADAKPERIKQQLSDYGVLVEEWGGKYQAVELSARTGLNVDTLLEKIQLEAEVLELKANPDRRARGTIIEAHVDKGRGNVATIMVQKGTLRVGDSFVAGSYAGRVRAMFDERGHRVEEAMPSTPVQVTGFDGLPEAGDTFAVAANEVESRVIATQRHQLRREQAFRQTKHITLDEISQQIQIGGVKDLHLIIKADFSGSAEALTDSLQKLSRDEVRVIILHRGVGAISESDVMLAAASDAVIIGFHVSPTVQARRLADQENVEIRSYSIIYDAINEIQLALEGLLTPETKEEILSAVEVRAMFKVSKLGTIAGCYVLSGKITRNDKVRVLRAGLPVFTGTIHSLRRVKDDVREVETGFECGVTLNGFDDFEEGDIIESFKTVEVKRKFV